VNVVNGVFRFGVGWLGVKKFLVNKMYGVVGVIFVGCVGCSGTYKVLVVGWDGCICKLYCRVMVVI